MIRFIDITDVEGCHSFALWDTNMNRFVEDSDRIQSWSSIFEYEESARNSSLPTVDRVRALLPCWAFNDS